MPFQSLPLEITDPSPEPLPPSLMTQSCIESVFDSASFHNDSNSPPPLPPTIPPPPTSSPPSLTETFQKPTFYSNSSSNSNSNRIQNNSNEKILGGVMKSETAPYSGSLFANGHDSEYSSTNGTGNGSRYYGGFTEKLYRTRSQPTLLEQLNSIDQRLKNRRITNKNNISSFSNNDNHSRTGSASSTTTSTGTSGTRNRTNHNNLQAQNSFMNSSLTKSSTPFSVAPLDLFDEV